jgi:hypothetical protein
MKKLTTSVLILILLLACKNESHFEKEERAPNQTEVSDQVKLKEQLAEVRVTVPDSRWSIEIVKVIQSPSEIAVLCQLTQSDGMGMMVISEVVDAVKFKSIDLPIQYYIQGKSWNWKNQEAYQFLNETQDILVPDGESLDFQRVKPSRPGGAKQQKPGI